MLDIIVQLDNNHVEPEKLEPLVKALSQFGYNPDIRVYVSAQEGADFEMLRTVLDSYQLGWSVVARKIHAEEPVHN